MMERPLAVNGLGARRVESEAGAPSCLPGCSSDSGFGWMRSKDKETNREARDFGAATFLASPVGLVVGAAGAGMPETMETGLAPRRLEGRDCARRLRRRWRTRRADHTGVRGPRVRTPGCFTRERRGRPATPRRPKVRQCVPSTASRLRSRAVPNLPALLKYPTPAGGGTAARARRPAGVHSQAVIVAMRGTSATTSTSLRESFSKARHIATSSQESRGPCSSPVASSTTV